MSITAMFQNQFSASKSHLLEREQRVEHLESLLKHTKVNITACVLPQQAEMGNFYFDKSKIINSSIFHGLGVLSEL